MWHHANETWVFIPKEEMLLEVGRILVNDLYLPTMERVILWPGTLLSLDFFENIQMLYAYRLKK